MATKHCCYVNSIQGFMQESEETWLNSMKQSFKEILAFPLEESQVTAWKDCCKVLKKQLNSFANDYPGFYVVFEYLLPYESGRRPDVLLVSKEQVIVLEFKQNFRVVHADIDQTAAYARDIREYHYESRDMDVSAVLVLTGARDIDPAISESAGIEICAGNDLEFILRKLVMPVCSATNIDGWLNSKYEPLPTIVEAAKMFVKKEALPNIRRVNSTCIPQAIECLKDVSKYAADNGKHVVAFVTGVPGAGKTFLGLKFVYDVCTDYENVNSVYLSGNGPLIAVLSDALHSSVFVKDLHKVITQYVNTGSSDFKNNIIVFDEGQRAWDSNQMSEKRGTTRSEPDVMIELCEKRLVWCVLLVLVGEGQEIHKGENAGIQQWNKAIERSGIDWEIICPDKLVDVFPGKSFIQHDERNTLNLTTSLRTHLAGDVSDFVNELIDGNISAASIISKELKRQGFTMYVTRDLRHGKRFLYERYDGEETKRYGMIASSKGRYLQQYGMDNSYFGALSQFKVGKWFNADVTMGDSCCALEKVATEFQCQGLEIDMPIVGWDSDMMWNGVCWERYKKNEAEDSDANVYRKNSYRVLLTRGRDGFVVFVPPVKDMDGVYEVLLKAGMEKLEMLQMALLFIERKSVCLHKEYICFIQDLLLGKI